jgi:hypothetical protein
MKSSPRDCRCRIRRASPARRSTASNPGAAPWRGLLIVDLTHGDIVEWLRIEGDVSDLFDVAVIPGVRCPRGLGPADREMGEVVRGEKIEDMAQMKARSQLSTPDCGSSTPAYARRSANIRFTTCPTSGWKRL